MMMDLLTTTASNMFQMIVHDHETIMGIAYQGMELSLWTFILTIVLELWSLDTVKKVLHQKGAGMPLYVAAVFANLRNHFLLGVPIYTTAAYLFCWEHDDRDRFDNTSSSTNENENLKQQLTPSDRLTSVASILFVQSVCFYTAHRAFHANPNWYKHHRFHHRFNTHVPPMAANAVSPVEYIFAYILPFTLILPVLPVDTLSLRIVVCIVSVTNLMIHTPRLGAVSERFMPEWLVSTEDHLEHHRKLNTKYAAPTFNVDYIVDLISEIYSSRGNVVTMSLMNVSNNDDTNTTIDDSCGGSVGESKEYQRLRDGCVCVGMEKKMN
jgi:sterol desaturase/sphingolipid hydroxylase (fatty acid hydroxylase superfamily)